jgi:hypothetical protein
VVILPWVAVDVDLPLDLEVVIPLEILGEVANHLRLGLAKTKI